MKAIEFKEQNVIFAKDQKEYAPLPAHGQQNGMVTFCMELTPAEVKKIRLQRRVVLTVLNFNRPVQPVAVHAAKPQFPVPYSIKLNVVPTAWDTDKGLATLEFELSKEEVTCIKRSKKLWITTVTYGAPLQPISGVINQ